MRHPRIKPCYRIYQLDDQDRVLIGQGLEKFEIADPTPEMVEFLRVLDGSATTSELARRFPDADAWLESLGEMGVIDDATADHDAPLDPDTARRWSRQVNYFRLYERDGWSATEAQAKLGAARVVVAGSGAGGSALSRLLAAAGVGQLDLIDFDDLELSNLPTHVMLDEEDVGEPKVEALSRNLRRHHAGISLTSRNGRFEGPEDVARFIAGADFFCVAFDRPLGLAPRWANRAAIDMKVPFGSIGATDKAGRIGPIVIPGESACYECIGLSDLKVIRLESAAALTGTTVFLLASIMAGEIVKFITGFAETSLLGSILFVDLEHLEFSWKKIDQQESCYCSGDSSGASAT